MVQPKEEVNELRSKFKNNCRIKEYSTHSSKIHSVDWNCDGRRLASGGFDKSVCIVGLSNDRLSKEVCIFLCIAHYTLLKVNPKISLLVKSSITSTFHNFRLHIVDMVILLIS